MEKTEKINPQESYRALANFLCLAVVLVALILGAGGFYVYFVQPESTVLFIGAIVLLVGLCLGSSLVIKSMAERFLLFKEKNRQLEDSLIDFSKMAFVGRMAAGVAHEINNPLMLIGHNAGWIEDLLMDEKDFPHQAEIVKALENIDKHTVRASKITHRLLGFARHEAKAVTNKLTELMDESLSFLEPDMAMKGIKLDKDYPDEEVEVNLSGDMLQQVILNLVSNGMDAILSSKLERDKKIQILVKPKANKVDIFIIDSGPGIPKDLLGNIFEPFFTTKKAGEGTGLGLAISHSIIDSMGGVLTVDNIPNQGAAFKIELPVFVDN